MATADNKRVIRIESILGGHSPTTHFAGEGQFMNSVGIDPALPIQDSTGGLGNKPPSYSLSGLLRPTPCEKISASTITNIPLWIKGPTGGGGGNYYVLDSGGSMYASATTALGDAGHLSNGEGNGLAYYDNYMYIAKKTDIARYGPLNGTPVFNGTYWTATLSKTALVDTTYPDNALLGQEYPNHVMHRHSDGRLYIADVVDNKGTIHYIKTTKTTVEGDTNDGSTHTAVQVGYGLYPMCMESYGVHLVIAFFEGDSSTSTFQKAKIAFWDTTSSNVNKLIWVEFPDPLITAMKNIDGVLYVVSSIKGEGFRVTKYIGGESFEEIAFINAGPAPFPGAVDGKAGRLLIGSTNSIDKETNGMGGVYSLGLASNKLGKGLFNVMRSSAGSTVTSLLLDGAATNLIFDTPVIGWSGASTNGVDSLDDAGTPAYNNAPSVWWSQLYRIGQPFKITKIRIPLAQAVAANMIVTAKVITDDGAGTIYTLTAINNTNDPGAFNIVRRAGSSGETILGQHNFWLELKWTGSALCVVGLPITIEYELLDD